MLYRELGKNRYALVGIVCSDEPLMTKWKWALALRVPAKVFILNENADYFWFDRHNWRAMRILALHRSGLAGAGAVRMLAQLAAFPFTLLYLLLYATIVHARRALRRRSRNTGQSGAGSVAGIRSSRCAPIAFDTRRSSTIETLPLPLSSWAI